MYIPGSDHPDPEKKYGLVHLSIHLPGKTVNTAMEYSCPKRCTMWPTMMRWAKPQDSRSPDAKGR